MIFLQNTSISSTSDGFSRETHRNTFVFGRIQGLLGSRGRRWDTVTAGREICRLFRYCCCGRSGDYPMDLTSICRITDIGRHKIHDGLSNIRKSRSKSLIRQIIIHQPNSALTTGNRKLAVNSRSRTYLSGRPCSCCRTAARWSCSRPSVEA